MLIGEKIRLLRKNKNVTQTQLAEALSVSSQSVSKWENHLSAPDLTVLPEIARYFGITMDELFNYRLDALNYKERFIRFMVNNSMLSFGEFKLERGSISPYIVRVGDDLTGSQMSKLGEFYAECIREHRIEDNCLIGIDNREVSLVIATSMTLFNKYGVDSYHCVGCNAENTAFETRNITLITDVITSGTTLSTEIEKIKSKTNKYPSDVVVCVDRMERSDNSPLSAKHEIERKYGLKIHSIVNTDDIINAIESGAITADEYLDKMNEYMRHYKGIKC
ncbi:MAG: helix-turn-helix domain-containing protein [Oscillospiraceae bacterium]|nr:helix-turn-helix domain-containing protein [Oscillospiraceae bacterium]